MICTPFLFSNISYFYFSVNVLHKINKTANKICKKHLADYKSDGGGFGYKNAA